jgi:polar amino acid transport system substrate-binding protein
MRGLLPIALSAAMFSHSAGAAEVLRVISPEDWCPFSCKAGAQQEGFAVELLRAIFEPAGYRVEYRNAPYTRALKMLRDGQGDSIPSVLKDEAPDFVFSARSIGSIHFCVYSHQASHWTYQTPADLAAHDVVLVQGYDYGTVLSPWFEANPQRLHPLSGNNLTQRMAEMVSRHRVEAMVEGAGQMDYLLSHQPQLQLRKAGCEPPIFGYLGFAPDNPNAQRDAQLYDQGVARLRSSGELDKILARYSLQDWDTN